MSSPLTILKALNTAIDTHAQGEPVKTEMLSAIKSAMKHLGLTNEVEGIEDMLAGDAEICLVKPDKYYIDVTRSVRGKWAMSMQRMHSDGSSEDITVGFSCKVHALMMGFTKLLGESRYAQQPLTVEG